MSESESATVISERRLDCGDLKGEATDILYPHSPQSGQGRWGGGILKPTRKGPPSLDRAGVRQSPTQMAGVCESLLNKTKQEVIRNV